MQIFLRKIYHQVHPLHSTAKLQAWVHTNNLLCGEGDLMWSVDGLMPTLSRLTYSSPSTRSNCKERKGKKEVEQKNVPIIWSPITSPHLSPNPTPLLLHLSPHTKHHFSTSSHTTSPHFSPNPTPIPPTSHLIPHHIPSTSHLIPHHFPPNSNLIPHFPPPLTSSHTTSHLIPHQFPPPLTSSHTTCPPPLTSSHTTSPHFSPNPTPLPPTSHLIPHYILSTSHLIPHHIHPPHRIPHYTLSTSHLIPHHLPSTSHLIPHHFPPTLTSSRDTTSFYLSPHPTPLPLPSLKPHTLHLSPHPVTPLPSTSHLISHHISSTSLHFHYTTTPLPIKATPFPI